MIKVYAEETSLVCEGTMGSSELTDQLLEIVAGSDFTILSEVVNNEGVIVCQGRENSSEFTNQLLELVDGLGYTIEE